MRRTRLGVACAAAVWVAAAAPISDWSDAEASMSRIESALSLPVIANRCGGDSLCHWHAAGSRLQAIYISIQPYLTDPLPSAVRHCVEPDIDYSNDCEPSLLGIYLDAAEARLPESPTTSISQSVPNTSAPQEMRPHRDWTTIFVGALMIFLASVLFIRLASGKSLSPEIVEGPRVTRSGTDLSVDEAARPETVAVSHNELEPPISGFGNTLPPKMMPEASVDGRWVTAETVVPPDATPTPGAGAASPDAVSEWLGLIGISAAVGADIAASIQGREKVLYTKLPQSARCVAAFDSVDSQAPRAWKADGARAATAQFVAAVLGNGAELIWPDADTPFDPTRHKADWGEGQRVCACIRPGVSYAGEIDPAIVELT